MAEQIPEGRQLGEQLSDLDRLQGSWTVAAMEMDGNSMAPPPGARIVIDSDRFESLGMGAVYSGKLRLNPRTKPKQFDLEFIEGPEKGNTSFGIYELSGDNWQICLTVTGKQRPTNFSAPAGSGCALEKLVRTTAQPPAAPDETPLGDPFPDIEGEWTMTACIANGITVPESMARTGRRFAQNGETTSWFGKQVILQAQYGVDRSTNPWSINYVLQGGLRQEGIWRVTDDGSLEICFGAPGSPRPSDFASPSGETVTLTRWKRSK